MNLYCMEGFSPLKIRLCYPYQTPALSQDFSLPKIDQPVISFALKPSSKGEDVLGCRTDTRCMT